MPKFSEKNAFLDDGIFLPKFLFYTDNAKSKSISPATSLNPDAALDGNGFQSSTSPSKAPKKRTIIIDKNSLTSYPEYGERVALLKRLQIAGFEIFLRSAPTLENPNPFHKLGENLENITQLHNLSTFHESSDYNHLAKQNVARDKTLLLKQAKDVAQAFSQNEYIGKIVVNDWKCDVQNFSIDRLLEPLNDRANELSFYEKAAFTLQRLPKEAVPAAITQMVTQITDLNWREDYNRTSEPSYIKTFARGAITILNAAPHLRGELLEAFQDIAQKIGQFHRYESVEDLLFSNINSVKDLAAALKVFPNRENALAQFQRSIVPSNISALVGLIEEFPQNKSQLIAPLKSFKLVRNSHTSQAPHILSDLYQEKDAEALTKLDLFLDTVNSEIAYNLYSSGSAINYKYASLSTFIKVAKEGSKEIYESKFIENFNHDLDRSLRQDPNTVIKIIKEAPPQIVDTLIESITSIEQLKDSVSIIVALVRARSERAQEFLGFYPAISSNSLRDSLSEMPLNIRKYCQDAHQETIPHRITLEDLEQVNYLREDATKKPKPVYLSAARLGHRDDQGNTINLDALKDKMKSGDLHNIAVVNLAGNSSEDSRGVIDFMNGLYETEPAPKHFIFSNSTAKEPWFQGLIQNWSDRISYEIVDYENYLGIKTLIDKSHKQEYSRFSSLQRSFNSYEQSASQNSSSSKNICVATGSTAKQMQAENSDSTKFTNCVAGEVLNGNSDGLLVRNYVLNRDITKSLDQAEYVPTNFVKIDQLQSLDKWKIDKLKNEPATRETYCQFSQQLTANKKFRLLSAHASESLVGLVGNSEGLTIERGDDDFFYATSSDDRVLTYIVKAPSPQLDHNSYDQLPNNNPIKKIIDEYRDPQKGFLHLADPQNKVGDYDPQNHDQWMEDVFTARSGVCRHRVAAVEYKLKKSGISDENFRSVIINGNHIVLEIKNNSDKWLKVDLGGGNSATITEHGGTYSAAEITQKDPISEEVCLESLASKILHQTFAVAASSLPSAPSSGSSGSSASLPPAPTAQSEAFCAMIAEFLATLKFKEITTQPDLETQILNPQNRNVLVATTTIEQHSNFLLEQAKNMARPIFYIDSPSKIDLGRKNIFINDIEIPTIQPNGLLADFLQNAPEQSAIDPNNKPIILINWQAFSSDQKLALNTMLDANRKINGVEIDHSFQIIGLCNNASQDPSFLSRHNLLAESKVDLHKISAPNLSEPQTIDLQGFPDWKRHLLGKVVVEGEKMVWQKSQFISDLENGISNFEIINLSSEAAKELQYELNQAKACGKLIYHGHEISCPLNLNIRCSTNAFEFTKFTDETQISVSKNITIDQAPYPLVNTQLFDILLCDKKIENGLYNEEKGLIEKCAATPDKVLKLFISSDLSDSQWYCLFNQAQEKGIKLELALAPKIELPPHVATTTVEITPSHEEAPIVRKAPKIIVSNNPNQTLQSITEPQFAVIDVEDFTYQDLVENITFAIEETGFKNFTKTPSEFLTRLQDGERITLKGQFTPDLLQMLEPIIASAGDNLTLILEDKSCLAGQVYEPLKWLPQSDYQVENHPEIAKFMPINFGKVDSAHDLTNSENAALEFIQDRKSGFTAALAESSLLRLVGHSGVGKSQLVKEFETNDQETTQVYRELSAFKNWATDKSDKTKILFIDESNIEDLHFTMFSPLKNDGKKRLFYQGEFFDLDETHKVVFSCNPAEYGGGRVEQKLFDDGKVPTMYLRDFPSSYIYEKILKDSIYEKLSPEIQTSIPESEFKGICRPFIVDYQELNSRKKSDQEANEETVRELQEKILIHLAKKLNQDQISPEIQTKNFISTNATKAVEDALNVALTIRQKQRSGEFPSDAVGLNGVLLEGDSGVGKSELIGALLASKNITEKKFGEEGKSEDQNQKFYKIDASLPLAQKRAIIVQAYEEGNIVWIDEINSCIDDGLEKVLNAALTGDHPDGKTDSAIPGFMLISSVNSVGLEGRSLISPALRHRVITPQVQSLKNYSQEDLTKIIRHWIEPKEPDRNLDNTCQIIAQDFKKCLLSKEGENLNLRMLKGSIDHILPLYSKVAELQNTKPSSTTHKLMIQPLSHTDEAIIAV